MPWDFKPITPQLRGYRQGLGADKINPKYKRKRKRPPKPGDTVRPDALPPKHIPHKPGADTETLKGVGVPAKRQKVVEPIKWVRNNWQEFVWSGS